MDELEDLLDAYWNLAFDEGKRNRSNGAKANEVLHKIREVWNRQANPKSAPEGSFNMWWDSDRVQPDNPYQKGSSVYWAFEGWCAALALTPPSTDDRKDAELQDAGMQLQKQNEKLKARCAELEQRNADWRNGGYTSLWKLRTEDRDRTIESQRCVLSDLRDRLAELYAEHSKSEEEWETHDQDRDRYLNDVGDVLGQDDIDESLIDAAKRVVAELAEAKMYKPALRTSQHSQPVRSHVNPDFPGDGKPRLAFFGIDETDEKFAERAGKKVEPGKE